MDNDRSITTASSSDLTSWTVFSALSLSPQAKSPVPYYTFRLTVIWQIVRPVLWVWISFTLQLHSTELVHASCMGEHSTLPLSPTGLPD